MKNILKEVYSTSGRLLKEDNRSFFVKSINMLLDRGEIKIEISPIGRVWRKDKNLGINEDLPNGSMNKFNVSISGYGLQRKVYLNKMTPEMILMNCAKILTDKRAKTKIEDRIKVDYMKYKSCSKCQGRKIILGFLHYCDGICFQCGGSGFEAVKSSVILKKNNVI